MGLIPDDVIAEIRSRADIVAVIGQHVQLKKAGRNWKGLCPFHGEKTPSFNVAPDKGFFYCFGCRKKGDAFTFVMEYQGKSFTEAAEVLAAQCGVAIPETVASPEAMRARGERAQMLEVNKLATQFFRETLAGRHGEPGRAYLEKRGTGDAVKDAFLLGYAPADWHGLADFLKQKRADLEIAVKLGLIARQPRAGGFYDRFRERLVCPVVMPGGEIAGFSARLVAAPAPDPRGGDAPVAAKYINSPESTVYKKSRLLFGLAQAREGMHQKKRCVLVEGNFDVISLHQAGFTETVAPLGTALTPEQVDLLRRMAAEVILFYDGDRAGKSATRAALELLVAAEVPVRIAWRPRGDGTRLEGQDPDSLVRAGIDVGEMFDRARDGVEHYAFEVWSASRGSSEARARALEDIARLAARVANPTRRDVITATLATAMDVPPAVVQRAIARASGAPGPRSAHEANAPQRADLADRAPEPRGMGGPPPTDELDLIGLLADHPQLLATAEANGLFSLLTDVRLRDMYSAALRGASLVELAPDALPPPAAKTILEARYAKAEHPDRQLLGMLDGLRAQHHARRALELRRKFQDATRRGALDEIRQLQVELTEHNKMGR